MKTIKDAAVDYAEDVKDTTNGMFYADCQDAFKSGVEFAQRWIPVEEERPEPGLIVLIKRPNYHLAFFDGLRWSDINRGFLGDVTHWRRLELE